MSQEVVVGHTDVLGDPQNDGRLDVTARVHRQRRGPAVGVARLLMGAAVADFDEPGVEDDADDLARGEGRDTPQRSGDLQRVGVDELGLELGLAVLEEHGDDLSEVRSKLLRRGALGMGAGPPGDKTDVEAGIPVALDDSGEAADRDRCDPKPRLGAEVLVPAQDPNARKTDLCGVSRGDPADPRDCGDDRRGDDEGMRHPPAVPKSPAGSWTRPPGSWSTPFTRQGLA